MQILILIEPKDAGGFRATAGEPFRISAEADSEVDATRELERMLRIRLKGTHLALLDLEIGSNQITEAPLVLEPIHGEDEFFKTLSETIEENRQRENEAQG